MILAVRFLLGLVDSRENHSYCKAANSILTTYSLRVVLVAAVIVVDRPVDIQRGDIDLNRYLFYSYYCIYQSITSFGDEYIT
jgi:hypothetical protein